MGRDNGGAFFRVALVLQARDFILQQQLATFQLDDL
jgi:hypothetical protein